MVGWLTTCSCTEMCVAGFIAKICDFGMSRLMDASKSHVSTSSMGTISYQPPELLLGEGVPWHRPLLWQACQSVKAS